MSYLPCLNPIITGMEKVNRILWIVAAGAFLVLLTFRIALLWYPTQDVGGVEGNIIYFIQRLLDHQTLYANPEQPPYPIAQYMPAYYLLVTGVSRITQVGPDDLTALFAINRAVSLICNLALLAVVFRMARSIFSLPARTAQILSFTVFVSLDITSYGRPDSLYHLLFLLCLYFFMKAIRNQESGASGRRQLIAAALFAATAIFTKQTAFVLPVSLVAWMVINRQYRNIIFFCAWYGAAVAVYLLLVMLFGNLLLFYKNVVGGVSNGIYAGWYISSIFRPFYLQKGLLFLLLFASLLYATRRNRQLHLRFLVTIMLILFFLLNIIMLKNGSNPGYMTEWWILLWLLLATVYAGIPSSTINPVRTGLIALVFYCGSLFIICKPLLPYIRAVSNSATWQAARHHFEEQKAFARSLISRMDAAGKETVFLNVYTPDNYLQNLLFRQVTMPQMDIVILASYPRATFNYSGFVQAIQNGGIKWMVMNQEGIQQQFFDLRLTHFRLVSTVAKFNLYQAAP